MVVKRSYTYSDNDLLNALKEANSILDGDLTISKYRDIQKKHNLPTAMIIIKRIGWNKAKEKADIKIINKRSSSFNDVINYKTVKQGIKEPFRYMEEKYGEGFTSAQYIKECKGKKDWPSSTSISLHIGWNNAKQELGYSINSEKPTEKDVIPYLLRAAEVYGDDITIEEFNDYLESIDEKVIKGFTIASYFGWNNIKEKAGLKNNKVGSNKNKVKTNKLKIQRNRFCKDCMEYEDCNIELQDCEYYDYYKEEVVG